MTKKTVGAFTSQVNIGGYEKNHSKDPYLNNQYVIREYPEVREVGCAMFGIEIKEHMHVFFAV